MNNNYVKGYEHVQTNDYNKTNQFSNRAPRTDREYLKLSIFFSFNQTNEKNI